MRKRASFSFVILLAVLLLPGACGQKGNAARYTVDLAAVVKGGMVRDFDLTQAYEFEHRLVIDEETQPFRSHAFSSMDEGSVLVHDDMTVARVSLADGSILATYGRVGRGPMEYTRVRRCSFLDDTVYVRSNTKMIAFEQDGTAVREYRIKDFSENLVILPGGRRFRFYAANFEHDVPLYDVIDEAGNVLRTSSVVSPSVGQTAIMYLNNALEYDGAWYCLPRHTETIWKISETEDIPWIELNQGHYKMPPEYLSTLEGRYDVEGQFIWIDDYALTGKYFYCRFTKGGKHFIVYDLERGKLLLHTTSRSLSEGGIPIEYDGETTSLWPAFIDDHHIIFRGSAPDDLWLFSRK